MFSIPVRTLTAALTVASIALMAAACGGRFEKGGSAEGEIATATDFLDKAGLHAIDTSINEEKEVPATARTTALHLQAVTKLTDWPGENDLDVRADALARTFGELAAVLESDNPDLARAGELAKKAHDDHHDFSHDVWEWLMDEAGIDSGAEEEGHE